MPKDLIGLLPPDLRREQAQIVKANPRRLCQNNRLKAGQHPHYPTDMTKHSPFRCFKTSPEVIRLAIMLYVRYPLSLSKVQDLLHERGIDVSHETVRFWWNRLGPRSAAEIRRRRVDRRGPLLHWHWHLDEVFVTVTGETHYLWWAVDHEGNPRELRDEAKRPQGCSESPQGTQEAPRSAQGDRH